MKNTTKLNLHDTGQSLPAEEVKRLVRLPALAGSMPVIFSDGSMFATDGATHCPKCNRGLEFFQTRGEVVRLFHDVFEIRMVSVCHDCHLYTTSIIRLKPGTITTMSVEGKEVESCQIKQAAQPYWWRRLTRWLKDTLFPG